MNETARGQRLHIAIFGRRNAGKSSLINALTDQNIALVSEVAGTTTDPVYKAMEILPIGPVVIIDTAGIDDVGALGTLRVEKSKEVLNKTDMVLLVIDVTQGITSFDTELINEVQQKKLPLVAVLNKTDQQAVSPATLEQFQQQLSIPTVAVSALANTGINELKRLIVQQAPKKWDQQPIIGDLVEPGDMVVLVTPIDQAAPKGRLILPQVQTIRDILDHRAISLVTTEGTLPQTLSALAAKPAMVVTDSQAFGKVNDYTPPDITLTSFSILFARYKGDLESLVLGAKAIDNLQPGDKVLIAEACTHHRVEDDIGTVKIPNWLRKHVGGELQFEWVSGIKFPQDLQQYKLVLHCGACMLNRREMLSRIMQVRESGVPIINYGVAIAHLHGILRRALSPFPQLVTLLDQATD